MFSETGDSVRLSFVIVFESQNHHKPTIAIFWIYSIYIYIDIFIYTILHKFYDLCEIQCIYSTHYYIDECFYNLLIYALMNFLLTCFCNIFLQPGPMDFGRLSGRSFLDRVAPPRSLAWHALACIFYMHGYIYRYILYIYIYHTYLHIIREFVWSILCPEFNTGRLHS